MSQIEQWMLDAAKDIMSAALERRTYQLPDTIVAIIASHAPSEAAAQPICGCCGQQATSSMGPCANTADGLHSWEFEIEHNDH